MASAASLSLVLCAAAFVSVVLAGPEPLHDIYNASAPASDFTTNLTKYLLVLPAGTSSTATYHIVPGMQSLGNTFATFSLEPKGIVCPHYHPRSSEILYVLTGTCNVSFVGQDPTDNTIFTKRVNALGPTDAIIIPRGTVHWTINTGKGQVTGTGSFDAEDIGIMFINRLFLYMQTEVIKASFQIKEKVAVQLQKLTNYPQAFLP
jgi:quercetin dioxygenase-like cupin family protein